MFEHIFDMLDGHVLSHHMGMFKKKTTDTCFGYALWFSGSNEGLPSNLTLLTSLGLAE